MDYNKIQEYARYNAKSVCDCGHTGDGGYSQHADTMQLGHGKCLVVSCDCHQFTWVGFTPQAKKALSLS